MTDTPPNRPVTSLDTEPYWQGAARHELLFQRCPQCKEPVFHPRALCPYCLCDALTWETSSGRGKVYSFTIQHVPLHKRSVEFKPKALGIVALEEGFHMFSEIVAPDVETIAIDDAVTVFFDHIDADLVLPKFKVVHP